MKNFAVFLLAFLVLGACQTDLESSDEEASVELSSEVERGPLPLEASFMSEHETFAYSFTYDGNTVQMLDEALSDAGFSIGPNFLVEGGAEITGHTVWNAEVDMVKELASAQLYGRHQVYRYSVMDGICTLDIAVVPYTEESLVMQLKVCPDQDVELGQEAFENLLKHLRIQVL